MNGRHLTEEEIQSYAETGRTKDPMLAAHMHLCEKCQAMAATYRMLFTGINEIESPHFDFDIASVVLEKVARPYGSMPGAKFLYAITIVSVIVFAGVGIYFFKDYTIGFTQGISNIGMGLCVGSLMAIMFFLFADTYRRYQKKIKQLNLN